MLTFFIISPFESVVEGRGTRNIVLSRKLVQRGHRVIFVTTDFSHQRKIKFRKEVLSAVYGQESYVEKIISIPTYKKNISVKRILVHLVLALKLYEFLKKNCRKGDVLLTTSIPPEIVFAANSVATRVGAKMWLDVRDVWPDAFPLSHSRIAKRMFRIYCDFFYTRSVTNVEAVSFISESIFDWVSRYKKIGTLAIAAYVPLGFDAERWMKSYSDKRVSGKLRLCYVGSLESQCPLDEILVAVRDKQEFEMIVIGSGSKMSHYRDLADPGVVTFAGRLDPSEVVGILAHCDVGVLPIVYSQGLPNKFFDYLGAGLPILHIGDSDAGEIVAAKSLGWNVSFDSNAISRTLQQIKRELGVRKKMVIKVREEYSKDNLYPVWIEQLEKFAQS